MNLGSRVRISLSLFLLLSCTTTHSKQDWKLETPFYTGSNLASFEPIVKPFPASGSSEENADWKRLFDVQKTRSTEACRKAGLEHKGSPRVFAAALRPELTAAQWD
ncbi:MAG: hypothetical protein EOP09_15725, partial [Proteobacteria bacterium]